MQPPVASCCDAPAMHVLNVKVQVKQTCSRNDRERMWRMGWMTKWQETNRNIRRLQVSARDETGESAHADRPPLLAEAATGCGQEAGGRRQEPAS